MSTRRTAIRLSQAFNAICKSARIDDANLTDLQKQIIFDQLALTCSDLGDNFDHGKFEDACCLGFNEP